jgi:hypothetical protein
MTDRFTFLPHARPQLQAGAARPSGTGQHLQAPFAAEILADGAVTGAPVLLSQALRGPGDITGFAPEAISAVDPDARTPQFETNHLPYVEFAEPDFPWRYTLDTGGADGRLQPWLVLIALKADEFDALMQGDAPLPSIRVLDATRTLPAVADGRFTAHVHVPGDTAGAVTALSGRRARARMLCPRRLEESTAYTLFLVPAYEQGRQAGLGLMPQASPFDAPAWGPQTGAVDLPFYVSRRFVTNAGEDVEAMVRRLRGLTAAEVTAAATPDRVDASDPGHYPGYAAPGATFTRRAATNAPGTADPAMTTDAALLPLVAATLAEVIAGEVEDGAGNDPLVAFPPYGWRFRDERGVNTAQPGRYWFDRLNLDLSFRDAAQRGAAVVQAHQDDYMRIAWSQYEEIVAANRQLAALQTAEALAGRIETRRISRLAPDVLLALAEPILGVVPSPAGTETLTGAIRSVGAPGAYASRAMRRVAARRQVPVGAGKARAVPAPSIPGDRDATGAGAIDRSPEAMRKRSTDIVRLNPDLRKSLEGILHTNLGEAVVPRGGAIGVADLSSADLAGPVRAVLTALPRAKADSLIGGRSPREQSNLAPVLRAPVIADPLAGRLRVLDPSALLPGLSKLPDNTVSFFEEDRAFIEAAMVGANHEMNAELRWRGFPTDMRGTILRRFWPRGYPAGDTRGDDIGPIHGWRGALGANPPSHDRDQAENLICVIKGDLVRKLGLLIVEINIAPGTTFVAGQGTSHKPIFFDRIGDAAYYGFDIARDTILAPAVRNRAFLVLSEPPGRLRFGLDVATQAARTARRDLSSVRRPFPVTALGTGRSFATELRLATISLPPATPLFGTWNDLSWSHVRLSGSGHLDFTATPRPAAGPDHWGTSKTAASVAIGLWQRPIAAILPLQRVL